jgi:hypothetical protein
MRIMIYLERGFSVNARSEAMHCIRDEYFSEPEFAGLFEGLSLQELIGTLGRFRHEYNIRPYVENNTTQQELSTRSSTMVDSNRIVIYDLPVWSIFFLSPKHSLQPSLSQWAARSLLRILPSHYPFQFAAHHNTSVFSPVIIANVV